MFGGLAPTVFGKLSAVAGFEINDEDSVVDLLTVVETEFSCFSDCFVILLIVDIR